MAAQPNLLDWLELLGLRQTFERILVGRLTVADALDDLQAARETYPHISQDYIEILDLAAAFLKDIQVQVDEEAQAVDAFNRAAAGTPYSFYHPRTRLLSSDERARLEALQDQFAREAAAAQQQQQRLEEEASDLEAEMERLADEALTEAEDALRALQEALEEAEDAQDEYEDAQDEAADEQGGPLGDDRRRRKDRELIESMAYWDWLMDNPWDEAALIEGDDALRSLYRGGPEPDPDY